MRRLRKGIVLGSVVFAFSAILLAKNASAVVIDTGDSVPMGATATVVNAMDLVFSHMDFGQLGVVGDPTNTATATITPGGAISFGTTGGNAKFVDPLPADHAETTVTITGAFPDANIYVIYSNVVDVVNPASAPEILVINSITDNLDAPDLGPGGVAGGMTSPGVFVVGSSLTTGAGALTFSIGAQLKTTANVSYQTNAAYQGSFDMTIIY